MSSRLFSEWFQYTTRIRSAKGGWLISHCIFSRTPQPAPLRVTFKKSHLVFTPCPYYNAIISMLVTIFPVEGGGRPAQKDSRRHPTIFCGDRPAALVFLSGRIDLRLSCDLRCDLFDRSILPAQHHHPVGCCDRRRDLRCDPFKV